VKANKLKSQLHRLIQITLHDQKQHFAMICSCNIIYAQ